MVVAAVVGNPHKAYYFRSLISCLHFGKLLPLVPHPPNYWKKDSHVVRMEVSANLLELVLTSCSMKNLNTEALFTKAKDGGMLPWKEFPCRWRYSRLQQSPMVPGIWPHRLFSDASSALTFFNLPTSTGRLPFNEFGTSWPTLIGRKD